LTLHSYNAKDTGSHPAWWSSLSGPKAVWVLNALVGAGALVLFLGPAGRPSALETPHLDWWLLALAFFVAELCVVHLHFRRSAHSFSLADLPLVLGLLFASGHDLLIGGLIGTGLTLAFERRLPPIKVVFNLAQFAFATLLAVVVMNALASPGEAIDPQLWVAAFVATEAGAIITVVLIGIAISLSEGVIQPKTLGRMLVMDFVVTITNTSLALAAAVIVANDARALPLLLVPIATVFLAYRAYLLQQQRHERLEFLYEATRTLSRSPEIVLALEALLSRSLEAFRAELAEIVLFSSEGGPPLRTTLGPGTHKEVMQPMEDDVAADLLTLVSGDKPAVRLAEPFGPERLRRYLESRRVTDAMLAVLPGEKRVMGTMMLANRFGVVRSFSEDDLKLFETLANNASVALQYDRLEQAVLQLRELQEQLEHQAFHDPLTDLANRSLFVNQVRDALAHRSNEVSVLFIDVDDFKTVNDSLGHAAGDTLLQSVADRLRECVRPSDVVARLGGDEFAVMVEDAEGAEQAAMMVTERIMKAFERPLSTGEKLVSVHASVGIATSGEEGPQADELIRDADVAMYQAKAAGKQRFELFEPQMRSAVMKRHGLKEELLAAIGSNQLSVMYQPIIDLSTNDVVAAEALVRWNHEAQGELSPAEFVPLAEETGLIPAVGKFVLDEACRQARQWQEASPQTPVAMHVNLSAVELQDPELVERVTAAIERGRIAPSQLVLEITESMLVEDAATITSSMQELRGVGVRLALDDFGTGYSSLSYLRSLPLDILKIAMPFVQGIDRGRRDDSFVRMILELARALELQVIAEGIESTDQLEVLRGLGCDLGQGFYIAPPLDLTGDLFALAVGGEPTRAPLQVQA
jgi:diguanylate cyclase (GGDEF)-like protein